MNRPTDDPAATGPETLLGLIADEFAERVRRGEQPDVEEYARAHPAIADVLRDLLPALCAPTAAAPPVPVVLGEYRIVREVGRGGMGVVYEAVQESLGRHVALKLLPPQAVADPLRLERFRREARAAGRLHHTNIVPVFGVGECFGLHYYAMQFIAARGLDDALRALRGRHPPAAPTVEAGPDVDLTTPGDAATPPDRLAAPGQPAPPVEPPPAPPPLPGPDQEGPEHYRRVARIGVQVADALAYAHSQGVIHRDIKPANLLIDQADTVWVTDFGLAKTADPDLTRTGDVVGTLRYMPPEQFRGDYSASGDVYSLGLTLYELATLRPAFDAPDWHRLADQIAHREPVPPRRLDRRVPRDLETIILRAAAKEPGRRYASAAELAADLRRFLADEPIRARRLGPWGHLARWGRRNPTLAGTLAALVLAIVGGAAAATAFWLRAATERDRAAARAAEAQAQARGLRAAVDRFFTATAEDPTLKARGAEPLRRRLLAEANQFYQQFLLERPEDPGVRAEYVATLFRLARINENLGDRKTAARLARQAIDETLADEAAGGLLRPELGGYYVFLARQTAHLGARDEAAQLRDEAARLARELAGAPEAQDRAEAARVLTTAAELAGFVGDRTGSRGLVREALGAWESVEGDDPHGGDLARTHRAQTHMVAAKVFAASESPEEARPHARAAIGMLEPLIDRPDAPPNLVDALAEAHRVLGFTCSRPGHFDEAIRAFERANALWERLAESHPDVPYYQRQLTSVGYSHALCLFLARRYDEAIPKLTDNLTRSRALAPRFPDDELLLLRNAANSLTLLGIIHGHKQDFGAKLSTLREALAINRQIFDRTKGRPDAAVALAGVYGDVGSCLSQLEKHDEALEHLDEAIARLDAILAGDPDNGEARRYQSNNWRNRAKALSALGRADDAVDAYRKSLGLARPDEVPALRGDEAVFLARAGHFDEAWESFRAYADAIREQPAGSLATARQASTLVGICADAADKGGPAAGTAKARGDQLAGAGLAALKAAHQSAEDPTAFVKLVSSDEALKALRAAPPVADWLATVTPPGREFD